MQEGLEVVVRRGFLAMASVAALRQCCRELAASNAVAELVARRHVLFGAFVAAPEGTRDIAPTQWRAALAQMASLREAFADATSLSAFSAPKRILGDGPMSTIDLYQHRATETFVAIKSYSKESLIKYKKAHEAMTEKTAMIALQNHRNVLQLFATFQTYDSLYFVLELCPQGDLVDLVRRQEDKRLPLGQCRPLLQQIITVVRFCHASGYLHRDVKCENLLLGADGRIRLSDFATAHRIGTHCEHPFVGSPQYLAPETIRGEQPTEKVDYFAVGCVAHYLWTGRDAFHRDSEYLIWKAILEEPLDLAGVPAEEGDAWMREFVLSATQQDANVRKMLDV